MYLHINQLGPNPELPWVWRMNELRLDGLPNTGPEMYRGGRGQQGNKCSQKCFPDAADTEDYSNNIS